MQLVKYLPLPRKVEELMFTNVKLIIALVLAAVVGLLGFGVYHYKSNYEDSLIEIGKLQDDVDDARLAATNCSDGTAKLEEEAKKKAAAAAAARAQANTLAVQNESLAQQLLAAQANSNDFCVEANRIANEYLAKKKKVIK